MRGGKPLSVVLMFSMLSACAARQGPADVAQDAQYLNDNPYIEQDNPYIDDDDVDERSEAVDAYGAEAARGAEILRAQSELATDYELYRYHDIRHVHYYEEPSPETQYAAEVAFLVTAQVFLCSFVVVVLNGHCDIGVSAGYYY